MRARFITNGVLALVELLGIIMIIAGVYSESLTAAIFGYLLAAMLAIANFVMGVITLAMVQSANQRGLGIASGVLAIFGGVLGVNAIVSFIGAAKESEE